MKIRYILSIFLLVTLITALVITYLRHKTLEDNYKILQAYAYHLTKDVETLGLILENSNWKYDGEGIPGTHPYGENKLEFFHVMGEDSGRISFAALFLTMISFTEEGLVEEVYVSDIDLPDVNGK